MSKQLYEEALADVKKLKEIAEDNAKKALIEAVSPRIKDLIEAELLKEVSDDDEMSDDLLMDDGEEVEIPSAMMPNQQLTIDPSMDAAISSPDEEGKVTLDLDAINVSSSPFDDQFELSNESIRLINPIIEKVNAVTILKIESKLFKLNESVEKFMDASDAIKKTINYQRKILEMVSKIESLYEYLQESAGNLHDKGVYEGKLEKLYKQLNNLAERYNMKNNLKSSLTEAEITLKLTNVPDELEDQLGDLGVDLVSDAGEGDEEEDAAGEEEDSADGEEELDLGGEEEDSAGEEEDSADGEEELDLGGEEEEEETEDEMQKMESRRLNNNTVVEIDENMLRREISRMRTLREADETKPQSWGHGAGDIGDLEDENLGDPLLDIDLSEAQDQEEEVDELDEADYQWDDQQEPAQDDENTFGRKPPPGHGPYQGQQNQGQQGQQNQGQQGQQKQGQQGQQKQGQQGQQKQGQQGQQKQGQQGHQQDEADEEQEEAQQVQEIRRRLTREAKVQSAAKKKAQSAKKQQREAQQKAKQKQQEVQQKLKQKKQLEAQKAKQEVQKQAKQAKKMQEAYVFYAKIFNESVRRTAKLQTILTENRNVANRNGAATRSTGETLILRKKLTETNLLNTKLLYCNKLLQNESLTKRQKADIIERLDEANSEREVKLVYESLVKTLGSSKTRSLSEGTYRVLGSSSQTTRPASTVLSEGYEAERWAKLAGLK